MSEKVWTEKELEKVNGSLEGKGPQAALEWVAENFDAEEFALACSFADALLLDMLVRIKPDARVFYIDTGLLFKETLSVVEKAERKYGVKVERYSSRLSISDMERQFGPKLWEKDPDRCCAIRKVEVLKDALKGLKVWITGIRRDETSNRAVAPVVGWDAKNGLIKVNPLVCCTEKEVWDYITANAVPYNELLDKGYGSIGCEPCTRPVKPGEDPRAGRWAGSGKKECGLHK